MLPASDLSEILTNLSALNLQPNTTAAILAAVLAPLLRSADPEEPTAAPDLSRKRAKRRRPRRAARSKPRSSTRRRKRKYAHSDFSRTSSRMDRNGLAISRKLPERRISM